jgi:bacillithiol system protein YtxJ
MQSARSDDTFAPLEALEQLESLIEGARVRPVIIFKHSPTCGTSAQAFDELESFLHEDARVAVHLVDVLRHRQLSQAIAARFGVRHESPQVLLVLDGQVRWHASHWRVTAEAIRRALEDIKA